MIATSRIVAVVAGLLAIVIHVGVSGIFAPDMSVEVESSAGTAEARLGASFADMSAGTLTPAKVETVTETVKPEQVLAAPNARIMPTQRFVVVGGKPDPAPVTALAALSSQGDKILPSRPQEVARAIHVEKLIAATPNDAALADAVATSPRPKRRKGDFVPPKPKKPAETAKAAPANKTTPNALRETGKVSTRQGATTGTETARVESQGANSGRGSESGNAAASNYPGQVMRQIARVRKPNINTRGVAVVAFAVTSNGGLSSLSIASSSGSAALDKAALEMVRKAQPFPVPPKGARRSFSIKIKGR